MARVREFVPAVPVLAIAAIFAAIGYYQAGTIPDSSQPKARYMIKRLKGAIELARTRPSYAAPVEDR